MPDDRSSPSAGWREVCDEMEVDPDAEDERARAKRETRKETATEPESTGERGSLAAYVAEAAARLAGHPDAGDETETTVEGD